MAEEEIESLQDLLAEAELKLDLATACADKARRERNEARAEARRLKAERDEAYSELAKALHRLTIPITKPAEGRGGR